MNNFQVMVMSECGSRNTLGLRSQLAMGDKASALRGVSQAAECTLQIL